MVFLSAYADLHIVIELIARDIRVAPQTLAPPDSSIFMDPSIARDPSITKDINIAIDLRNARDRLLKQPRI